MGIPPLKWFCHVTTPITTFHLSMGISSLVFILSFKGSIDPIQYPVPTHGYTTPHDHFVDVPSGMTQSNTQLYPNIMNGYITSKMVLSCHHPYYNISFIHGCTIPCVHFIKGSDHPYDHFVDVPPDMTQSNTQLQYMSIPPL